MFFFKIILSRRNSCPAKIFNRTVIMNGLGHDQTPPLKWYLITTGKSNSLKVVSMFLFEL